jgi:hypothetical protein
LNSPSSSHAHVTCLRCGEVIGVYEPMVVLLDGEAVLTSPAAARGKIPPEARRYHQPCFGLGETGEPVGA